MGYRVCIGAPYLMQQAHSGYDHRNLPKVHLGKYTPHGHSSLHCDSTHSHMVSALMGRIRTTPHIMCNSTVLSPQLADISSANPEPLA